VGERFTDNKKGCDANFTSLALTMSWSELLLVSLAEYSERPLSDFDGVLLSEVGSGFLAATQPRSVAQSQLLLLKHLKHWRNIRAV